MLHGSVIVISPAVSLSSQLCKPVLSTASVHKRDLQSIDHAFWHEGRGGWNPGTVKVRFERAKGQGTVAMEYTPGVMGNMLCSAHMGPSPRALLNCRDAQSIISHYSHCLPLGTCQSCTNCLLVESVPACPTTCLNPHSSGLFSHKSFSNQHRAPVCLAHGALFPLAAARPQHNTYSPHNVRAFSCFCGQLHWLVKLQFHAGFLKIQIKSKLIDTNGDVSLCVRWLPVSVSASCISLKCPRSPRRGDVLMNG